MKKFLPKCAAVFLFGALLTSGFAQQARAADFHDPNRGHNFTPVDWSHDHGHDIHHFQDHDYDAWRGGHWWHGAHGSRLGWWWVLDNSYYYYPAPVYPYPDPYVPPVVAAAPVAPPPPGAIVAPAPVSYWYYCSRPRGYYPYVAACRRPWRAIPAAPVAVAP